MFIIPMYYIIRIIIFKKFKIKNFFHGKNQIFTENFLLTIISHRVEQTQKLIIENFSY